MSKNKKKSGLKKFMFGAAIGAGLGMLFAPKKGSETRKELKEKLNSLVLKVKDLKQEDVKSIIEEKVIDIQNAIDELDSEKVLSSAKNKAKKIQSLIKELGSFVAQKSVPAIDKTLDVIKEKADIIIDETLKKLEK